MKPPQRIELTPEQTEELLERVKTGTLQEGDYPLVKTVFEGYFFLSRLVDRKAAVIKRLLRMMFGSRSEKTKDVVKDADGGEGEPPSEPAAQDAPPPAGDKEKKKKKGHGRNGAGQYTGAPRIKVPHPELEAKDLCPDCRSGKVYEERIPETVVYLEGKPPVQATVYELQKLRCNLCGKVYSADMPPKEGTQEERPPVKAQAAGNQDPVASAVPERENTTPKKKPSRIYDATVGTAVALLRYGTGFPFYRLGKFQAALGVPLPPSTQWDLVEKVANRIYPVFDTLVDLAAQGNILHNDDTTIKIQDRIKQLAASCGKGRKGTFTTAIVSVKNKRKIALFFSGENHAGENLKKLLEKREKGLAPPIQMCDALSWNAPGDFPVLLANCLSHGRRKFVEVIEKFPQPCREVLVVIRDVYINDDISQKQEMSDLQRLRFHQEESGPRMEELNTYLHQLLKKKKVEPNSGMGQAASYMLKHWEKLTLFLRVPGAPLDNNICERAIKMAIMHRKNSLFYRTEFGAFIGDMFMSFIHTCCLNGINPFDYLTKLQQYSSLLFKDPGNWLPWNYQETIAGLPP